MRKEYNFTLVELLVTVGIIAILAGLVLPAVRMVQQRGRITAAKSDMTSILMALKGVESTYSKMITQKYGSVNITNKTISFGKENVDDYNKLIVELTAPTLVAVEHRNVNKRGMKFLDPRPDFNMKFLDPRPDVNLEKNIANNADALWRDPWGTPYTIIINYEGEDKILHPAKAASVSGFPDKTLGAKAIVYSWGPNGTDDKGLNIEQDAEATNKLQDDIASWHK